VQTVEPIGLHNVTELRSHFSTNFSSAVLKTSWEEGHRNAHRPISCFFDKKTAPTRAASHSQIKTCLEVVQTSSTCNFFQKFLIDIEVGMNILHVVIIFQRLKQPNHLRRLLPFQLDVIIWNHTYAR